MTANEGSSDAPDEVVLMVCVECGREVQFEGRETPPAEMKCEKCGNEVFRRFDAASPDEARAQFREETQRDMKTTDPPTDTESGDVLDVSA